MNISQDDMGGPIEEFILHEGLFKSPICGPMQLVDYISFVGVQSSCEIAPQRNCSMEFIQILKVGCFPLTLRV